MGWRIEITPLLHLFMMSQLPNVIYDVTFLRKQRDRNRKWNLQFQKHKKLLAVLRYLHSPGKTEMEN